MLIFCLMSNPQPITKTLVLRGEAQMHACARALAAHMKGGECLLLSGTLGTGKTTFARAFIRALCGEDTEVVSPTFMLVQEYQTQAGFAIAHYDLYRLEDASELWELGIEEQLGQTLLLVEWPEIGEGIWPQDSIALHITHDSDDNASRELQVSAQGAMVAAIHAFIADWESAA